eukprot:Blabericola_migrator_1__8100@NODE_416_length_8706_cov_42_211136_g328_i0_p2_GENE_NODE_416_length_8706_cov_42_211136_g328_i0NODE_416_length_8706_cov_42_211136_g328_i0_p2_ORF_typecomplete_len724_score152_07IMCp/PF12314_8/93IMCp/PF12314_8/0_34IMCp/PF12314_8/0_02_NODE_416_length_8706_cov_42_211136_g328_i014863657
MSSPQDQQPVQQAADPQAPWNYQYEGHVMTELRDQDPAVVTVGPADDGQQKWAELPPDALDFSAAQYTRIVDTGEESGLHPPLPKDPLPARGRAPVYFEPQGFVEVDSRAAAPTRDENDIGLPVHPGQQYVTGDQFENFAKNFKREDGRYVAMTAYGAVPVPDDVLKEIPDRFISNPLFESSDTFIPNVSRHDRITEKPYTQHQHSFVEVVKRGNIDKLIPAGEEKKIVIPRYVYKAIVAENVIEVPQGTKYTETPIDVHMRYPPKIVPVRKAIVVQRNIECTKPVVQEKIIEVPKIVKKNVPKTVIKEIPFIVPKYVEKIIEVPFKPGMQLPPPTGEIHTDIPGTPMGAFAGGHYTRTPGYGGVTPNGARSPMPAGSPMMYQQGEGIYFEQGVGGTPGVSNMCWLGNSSHSPIQFMGEGGIGAGARLEGETLFFGPASGNQPQTVYIPPGVKELKFPYEAKIDVSIVQADEVPANTAQLAQNAAAGLQPGHQYDGQQFVHGSDQYAADLQAAMAAQRGPEAHPGMQAHGGSVTVSNYQGGGGPEPNFYSSTQAAKNMPTIVGAANNYAGGPGGVGVDQTDASHGCCGGKSPYAGANYEVPLPPPPRRRDPNAAYVAPMDPVIIHDVPGMRNVEYHAQSYEPQVLTRSGVTRISRLGACQMGGDPARNLYPPLSSNVAAPIDQGQLDFEELERVQEDYRSKLNPSIVEALEKQQKEAAQQKKD